MEHCMSAQPALVERIERLTEAIEEWLFLSRCPEWRREHPGVPVDPQAIIKAHESNQFYAEQFADDPRWQEIKRRWDAYYPRARQAEEALAEHGEAVAVGIVPFNIPNGDTLALFLENPTPQLAELVRPVLAVARVRALAADAAPTEQTEEKDGPISERATTRDTPAEQKTVPSPADEKAADACLFVRHTKKTKGEKKNFFHIRFGGVDRPRIKGKGFEMIYQLLRQPVLRSEKKGLHVLEIQRDLASDRPNEIFKQDKASEEETRRRRKKEPWGKEDEENLAQIQDGWCVCRGPRRERSKAERPLAGQGRCVTRRRVHGPSAGETHGVGHAARRREGSPGMDVGVQAGFFGQEAVSRNRQRTAHVRPGKRAMGRAAGQWGNVQK
jgi:hypothetical protein